MATPVTLKVFRGDELVRTEHFTRDIIKIGRLSSAHLCLEDERISRIHSVIEVGADGRVSIIDMGSAEGTFVNGKRVSKGPLRHGDEIKLGGLRIVVEGNDPAVLAQPVNRALDVPGTALPPAAKAAVNGHASGRAAVTPASGHVRPAGQNGLARASGPLAQGAAAALAQAPAAEPVAPPAPVRRRVAMALTRPVD
ncbi:MAG TPA: FHA domain-containing protein, partial [Anaeromyxobacteraceae bacterium]